LEEHAASVFKVKEYVKQETSVKAGGKPDFLLGLFFSPEDGGDMFLLQLIFSGPHSTLS
jgi:hypothetical protein